MPILLFLLLLLLFRESKSIDREIKQRLNRLAFGSCNKVSSNNDELWKSIESYEPDIFAWMVGFLKFTKHMSLDLINKYNSSRAMPFISSQVLKRS
jgi:hypothetical protein